MNVAIFGGTFDPVHRGHLAVARAAQKRYKLGRIYFVPADVPPHKQRQPVTPFHHRYAMLALALAGQKDFLASLMEGPGEESGRPPSYTLDTMRRFRAVLPASDRLFFLVGIDSFLEIATWHEAETLLREVEFIVASRPGFSLADVAEALPAKLRPADNDLQPLRGREARGELTLGAVRIHLLPDVDVDVSATQARAAAARGRPLQPLVGKAVADYIRKMHLYKPGAVDRAAAAEPGKVISIHGRAR